MPSELKFLAASARRLLAEANAKSASKLKDAKPSEDIPADCLKAANGFRDSLSHGDTVEQVAQDFAAITERLASAVDPIEQLRAAKDIEVAALKMEQAVNSAYQPFKAARVAFYSVALAWEMYNPPKSVGTSSEDIDDVPTKQLAEQITYSAKNLQTNSRDFLEKAARASKLFRNAAKKLGLEQGEMNDSAKKELIDAGFDARGAAEPLFYRVKSVLRRAAVLFERAQKAQKYEAKAKKLKIELDFEDDPEFGGRELL